MASSPSSEAATDRPPSAADIAAASERLAGRVRRTPLLDAPALDQRTGGRLLLKAEMLQHTGSFKIRGALNRISMLDAASRRRGIVAYSSGNHAQGVAAAAALEGVGATIVMPSDAPRIKIAGTRRWGAEIVFHDRERDNREDIAAALADESGATLVKPYDDPVVIAGQGTVGLELAEQAAERGVRIDTVLVPCGGGGLTAGCALALRDALPDVEIFSVEPDGFDDTARSLAAGRRLENTAGGRTICDALMAREPGKITYEINRRLLSGGLAVGEAQVLDAMAQAFIHLKVIAEPGGAVALAAALGEQIDCRDRTVAIIGSGGNADPKIFRRALETSL